jgi:hypothetical protein
MKAKISGGCLCGATRYELGGVPSSVGDCHCIDCRKSSGAPFVTWGSVDRAAVRLISGELRRVAHANRVRCFASCCGTQLFFEDSADSATIDVTIATLDHPEAFSPKKIIWLEDRLPWVVLDPALPQFQRSSQHA